MSTENTTGRVAVITGASSGIGEATARALAADGHRVALLARRLDRIQALADELGDAAIAIQADVTDRDSIVAAAQRVAQRDPRPPHRPGAVMTESQQRPDKRGTNPTMAATTTPTVQLNNGVQMPALGFGVFQTPPEETAASVETALRVGYRLIDTAAAYGNEREVAEGIRRSGGARDDVFLETKVWISDYGHDATLHAFDKSAGKLGVDQLDLLLLHQPLPSRFELTLDAYRALERLLADGKVRAIGVSNFMPEPLDRLLTETSVVPAVNQIELHPYFQQTALQGLHAENGIVTQAWSPIGGITSYGGGEKSTFEDPTLLEIARQHGKSAAQVMLRWHLQKGRSAIPKSTKPARIAENFDVFDFELAGGEVAAIEALDTGVRGGPDPESITLESFGREIPEA